MTQELTENIAVLGAGHMGSRLALAWAQKGYRVTATCKNPRSVDLRLGYENLRDNPRANLEALEGAQVLILGVKPPDLPDLLKSISQRVKPDQIIISLAVGVEVKTLIQCLNPRQPLARAMPNLPVGIGLGLTSLSFHNLNEQQERRVQKLFGAVGKTLAVPEADQNFLAAAFGSGPAYLYYLTNAFLNAAARRAEKLYLGLDRDQLSSLLLHTFLGALELWRSEDVDLEELVASVKSPKGVTQAALEVLGSVDFNRLFERALSAASGRAGQIGEETAREAF